MPRPRRVHYPGGYYYVALEGATRAPLFMDDEDRRAFVRCLNLAAARYHVVLLAWALTARGVHMVVRVGRQPLGYTVQSLTHRYSRFFRDHHGRRRQRIFRARYQACLVEPARWLKPVVRYVVRHGQANGNGPWAAHGACCGFCHPLTELHGLVPVVCRLPYSHCRFGVCHQPQEDADERYLARTLPRAQMLGLPFSRYNAGVAGPGSSEPELHGVVRKVCHFYGLTPEALAEPRRWRRSAEARGMVAWLCRETGIAPLSEVARRFGRHLATISIAVRRIDHTPRLRAQAQILQEQLQLPAPALHARPFWLLPPACPGVWPGLPVSKIPYVGA